MSITAKTMRNAVLALAVAVVAFLSFAQVSHALSQSDVDFFCGIFNCTDEQRTKAEALVDEEGGTVLSPALIGSITRGLYQGLSGDDVTLLQEILASDSDIYPEGLVTGFFGPLTEKAVKKFQKRFGIEQVGVVGPITRGTLNNLLKGKGKGRIKTVTVDDSDLEDNDIDFSEFTSGTTGVAVCHVPRGNPDNAHTIAIGGPAVQAHLRHGDSLGSCGGEGTGSGEGEETVMEDAQQALDDAQQVIDDAQTAIDEASGTTTDAVALLADAQSKLDDAKTAFDDEEYADAKSLAEDAEQLAEDAENAIEEEEDTTAPVISNVLSQNVSSTTAEIFWETDEAADSTVWYSDSTPVDTDTADSETDGSDVPEHTIELSGLTASTTYYYIVGSTDPSDNEATSTEEMFATLSE